jgi:hypothetical protein
MTIQTKFYQIEQPTTEQIFKAILNKEYIPLEKMQSKCKQINVLLQDHYNTKNVLITFLNVTNTGGFPIFFGENESLYEVASDVIDDWNELDEEEQNNHIELLGSYTRTYESVFNVDNLQ